MLELRAPRYARAAANRLATMDDAMALIEVGERKPYWRYTKWQMLASVVPFLVLVIVLPMYADELNARKFLGFPLGYFLAGHGIWLIALFTMAAFVNRQDAIDHWHGANEDS